MPSTAELDRRHRRIRQAMRDAGYGVLVFPGSAYVGHKGSLRYLTGYGLSYRRGFVVFPVHGDLTLIVPEDPESARREVVQGGEVHINIAGGTQFRLGGLASGVIETIERIGIDGPVGLVNADEVMSAGDYRIIADTLAGRLRDPGELFERVRCRKSVEEIAGLRRANATAEEVLAGIRSCLKPGVPERTVAAEAYRVAFSRGTTDTLFLLTRGKNGLCGRYSGLPNGETPFEPRDVVSFSIELDGPEGYFVEFARPLCLGEPRPETREEFDVLSSTFALAGQMLKPGVRAGEVYDAVQRSVSAHGYSVSSSYIGHGIGQDIMERPFLRSADDWILEEGMTVAFHPQILDGSRQHAAYMADVYMVTPAGGEPLSRVPLQLQLV